jgi:hypothetical protein
MSENIYPVSQHNIPEDFNFQQRGRENLSLAKLYSPELHFSARGYEVCEEFTALIINLSSRWTLQFFHKHQSVCSTLQNLRFQNVQV